MLMLDYYAHHNALRHVHPLEKLLLAGSSLLLCLLVPSPLAAVEVIAFMGLATVAGARVPARFYLRLLLLPLSFLLPGALAIAFTLTTDPQPALYSLRLGAWYVNLEASELTRAVVLFFRSLGAVSCLYFLSLTTPVAEIAAVLRQLKVPSLFLELLLLVYRSTFVLWETAGKIYTSQAARQGYSSLGTAHHSLGALIVNLFSKAQQHAHLSYLALLARCSDGELPLPEVSIPLSRKNLGLIGLCQLVLLTPALMLGGGLFG